MKRKRVRAKTKTKSYEQIKNFAIAVLAIVVLVVVAMNVQSLKIGSSEAWGKPTPVPASPKIAYPEFRQDTTGLTHILVPGATNTLYRFKVTAKGGPVALKKFAFMMAIYDTATTSTSADVGGFTILRDGVDITSNADIRTWNYGDAYSENAEAKGTNDLEATRYYQPHVIVQFGNRPWEGGEEIIPKNTTVTYTLKGITGTGFMSEDTVLCVLDNYVGGGAGKAYLNDYDARVNNSVAMRQNQYAHPYLSELIWSDMSARNHSARFDDLGQQTLSSNDWFGGYGVKYFPMQQFYLYLM